MKFKAKKKLTKRPRKKNQNQKNKDINEEKHMRNCNWRTKLKKNKIFIKVIWKKIRNEIKLKNQSQIKQLCTLFGRREKKNINDNLTTIHHHVSHLVKENIVAHSKIWWNVGFGCWVVLNASSKWCRRHILTDAWLARVSSFLD